MRERAVIPYAVNSEQRQCFCRVAKKGALLVSEETVRKGRGRKQQPPQPVATSMPAIPAAEAAPKARGRRIKAVAAPMIKSEEDAVAQEQPLTAGIPQTCQN